MQFVYELPPFQEKDFPIYFFFIFLFFPTAHSFTVLSHFKETVNNVYNDTNDFMYSRGNKW